MAHFRLPNRQRKCLRCLCAPAWKECRNTRRTRPCTLCTGQRGDCRIWFSRMYGTGVRLLQTGKLGSGRIPPHTKPGLPPERQRASLFPSLVIRLTALTAKRLCVCTQYTSISSLGRPPQLTIPLRYMMRTRNIIS